MWTQTIRLAFFRLAFSRSSNQAGITVQHASMVMRIPSARTNPRLAMPRCFASIMQPKPITVVRLETVIPLPVP